MVGAGRRGAGHFRAERGWMLVELEFILYMVVQLVDGQSNARAPSKPQVMVRSVRASSATLHLRSHSLPSTAETHFTRTRPV